MNLIFMGTPEFAVPSLQALIDANYTPSTVVTGPDRPRGRGQKVTPTPVKKRAQEYDLEILQPESLRDPSFADEMARREPEIIVVVAYRILPPEVFTRASLGAFNLHASLLPAFRGAAPINRAIMEGASKTGVTTFFLEERVDSGPIILRQETEIGPDETAGELHDRLKVMGAEAVVKTVRLIEAGNVEPQPQKEIEASRAPKIHREDCRVPWHKPALQVHNHIRGLSPYPGAWTKDGETLLKIYRSNRVEGETSASPGTVLCSNRKLIIACGEGILEITELQQEGRSQMRAEDFLNGYDLPEKTILR